ncbi:MAG TPA: response regulator transcription factor [Bryobacteraceae bacterium]|jgi:DNA-binding NarL/FixJ family response regulator
MTSLQCPIPRNCFRCGAEFHANAATRVCEACRKPKVSSPVVVRASLTFREKQLVGLVSEGKANKEIAFELHLAEGTIKEYLNRVYKKLQLRNRTELAVWALRQQAAA